jgi:hypothetical protein
MWDDEYWALVYYQVDYWGELAPGDVQLKDERTSVRYRILGPTPSAARMLGGVRIFVERK